MNEEEQGKAALFWMRQQAKQFNFDVTGNEDFSFCARVITARIEKMHDALQRIVLDGQGSVFMLQEVKRILKI